MENTHQVPIPDPPPPHRALLKLPTRPVALIVEGLGVSGGCTHTHTRKKFRGQHLPKTSPSRPLHVNLGPVLHYNSRKPERRTRPHAPLSPPYLPSPARPPARPPARQQCTNHGSNHLSQDRPHRPQTRAQDARNIVVAIVRIRKRVYINRYRYAGMHATSVSDPKARLPLPCTLCCCSTSLPEFLPASVFDRPVDRVPSEPSPCLHKQSLSHTGRDVGVTRSLVRAGRHFQRLGSVQVRGASGLVLVLVVRERCVHATNGNGQEQGTTWGQKFCPKGRSASAIQESAMKTAADFASRHAEQTAWGQHSLKSSGMSSMVNSCCP